VIHSGPISLTASGRAKNGLSGMMRYYGRISSIVVLAALGVTGSAHAQPRGRFERVTTTAQGDAVRILKANRLARPGGPAALSNRIAREDLIRPYSSQRMGLTKSSAAQPPGSSSWQLESPRPAAPRLTAAPAQPHSYYPALAAGRAAQQPVVLSTRAAIILPLCLSPCTDPLQAGAGHQAASGHHR
jgi:hypothetical protein